MIDGLLAKLPLWGNLAWPTCRPLEHLQSTVGVARRKRLEARR